MGNEEGLKKISPTMLEKVQLASKDEAQMCLVEFDVPGSALEEGCADKLSRGLSDELQGKICEAFKKERFVIPVLPVCLALSLLPEQIKELAGDVHVLKIESNPIIETGHPFCLAEDEQETSAGKQDVSTQEEDDVSEN